MNAVAIDCEMVGDINNHAMAAWVAVVDGSLSCIYKSFVQPTRSVHDSRGTGITQSQMLSGKPLQQVKNDVGRLISGRLLVGHSVRGDLDVLGVTHPANNIRDVGEKYKIGNEKPSLKDLARNKLGVAIQTGQHDPEEDARAAMKIYKLHPW